MLYLIENCSKERRAEGRGYYFNVLLLIAKDLFTSVKEACFVSSLNRVIYPFGEGLIFRSHGV
jgi:hypothetical protein